VKATSQRALGHQGHRTIKNHYTSFYLCKATFVSYFPYSGHSLLDLPFEKLLLHLMQINIYVVNAKIKKALWLILTIRSGIWLAISVTDTYAGLMDRH
jgi:hypothetical protein